MIKGAASTTAVGTVIWARAPAAIGTPGRGINGGRRWRMVLNMVSWRSMRAVNSAIWARIAEPRTGGACEGATLDATRGILAHWFIDAPSSSALDAGSGQSRRR